ncbi:MAG TPA: hypothetical protein DD738_15695 [Ruminiclostridium sp.]|nr:hypothetical protein [Ruminiclostridium sp.]
MLNMHKNPHETPLVSPQDNQLQAKLGRFTNLGRDSQNAGKVQVCGRKAHIFSGGRKYYERGDIMFDLKNSPVFQSLPGYVRESIMQSGIDFQDEEHLRQFASTLDQEFQQLSSQVKEP